MTLDALGVILAAAAKLSPSARYAQRFAAELEIWAVAGRFSFHFHFQLTLGDGCGGRDAGRTGGAGLACWRLGGDGGARAEQGGGGQGVHSFGVGWEWRGGG